MKNFIKSAPNAKKEIPEISFKQVRSEEGGEGESSHPARLK